MASCETEQTDARRAIRITLLAVAPLVVAGAASSLCALAPSRVGTGRNPRPRTVVRNELGTALQGTNPSAPWHPRSHGATEMPSISNSEREDGGVAADARRNGPFAIYPHASPSRGRGRTCIWLNPPREDSPSSSRGKDLRRSRRRIAGDSGTRTGSHIRARIGSTLRSSHPKSTPPRATADSMSCATPAPFGGLRLFQPRARVQPPSHLSWALLDPHGHQRGAQTRGGRGFGGGRTACVRRFRTGPRCRPARQRVHAQGNRCRAILRRRNEVLHRQRQRRFHHRDPRPKGTSGVSRSRRTNAARHVRAAPEGLIGIQEHKKDPHTRRARGLCRRFRGNGPRAARHGRDRRGARRLGRGHRHRDAGQVLSGIRLDRHLRTRASRRPPTTCVREPFTASRSSRCRTSVPKWRRPTRG